LLASSSFQFYNRNKESAMRLSVVACECLSQGLCHLISWWWHKLPGLLSAEICWSY
jgi:hypothetical protein